MSRGLRTGATLDLLRHYAAVFRQAWRERQDTPRRPAHEVDFLPAALALQERPLSPAPRLAMALIGVFALIALIWAVFGQIDIVATARGKIVPSDRTKVIQPFETSTVKAIRVADGQSVRSGEVLLELDATSAEARSEERRRRVGKECRSRWSPYH